MPNTFRRLVRVWHAWIVLLAAAIATGCGPASAPRPMASNDNARPTANEAPAPTPPTPPPPVATLRIRGVIVDEQGAPLAQATITWHRVIEGQKPQWGGQVVSDDEGRFAVEKLREGERVLLVGRAIGFIEPSALEPAGEAVEAGRDDARVVMKRGQSIAGTLVGPDGKPLGGVNVVLAWPRTGRLLKATAVRSADDGTFDFDGLEPGTYQLRATDNALANITDVNDVVVGADAPVAGFVLRASRVPAADDGDE
ncbi:MAG: carboxypeptidase-like regulatory domain-containing protein [Planctomycetota bacterium]